MAQRKFIVLTLGAVLVATAAMQAYVFVYQGSLAALIGQANSAPGVDSYCFNPDAPTPACSGFSGIPSGYNCYATYSGCQSALSESGTSSSSGTEIEEDETGGGTAGPGGGGESASAAAASASAASASAAASNSAASASAAAASNSAATISAAAASTSAVAASATSASNSAESASTTASEGSTASAASDASSAAPVEPVPEEPACGDGNEDEDEGCDDGNTEDGDGCSAACTDEDLCGNTQPDEGEECDDGNDDDGDACTNNCVINECNDGIDNNNNGVMDADEPECYTPTNIELLDDEIYHPDDPNYPGNSSPGDDQEQIGFFRSFFANLFARLKAFLIGQAGPVFMPGNAEGDLCAGQPMVDPDNNLPLGPNPNPVAGFNPHESPFHCWMSGGVNWAGQCGMGCRCADGSAFLDGVCVATNCTGACAEEQVEVNCTNCCDAPTETPEQPEPEEPSAIDPSCVPTRMVFTENIVQGAGIAYYAGDPIPPVSTVTPGLNPEEGVFHCYVSGGIAWAPNCGTNKCQCPTGVANFSAPCNNPDIAEEAGGYDEEEAEEAEPDTCNNCANSCVQEDDDGNKCPSLHGTLNCLIGSPQCCPNGDWRCPNGITGESNCGETLEPEENGCTPINGALNCFIGSPACCPSLNQWICPNGITGEYNCDGSNLNENDSSAASSVASQSVSSQSASIQSCTTDSDCNASCSTCDVIPGYGCGKKCHNLICTNGICGGGQQYVFCASNACPETAGSSSRSSESNGIGTGGGTGNNNNGGTTSSASSNGGLNSSVAVNGGNTGGNNGTTSSASSNGGLNSSVAVNGGNTGGNNGTTSSAGSSLTPGSCSNDSQCPFGDYCIGGKCKECVSNIDCPAGNRCQNNTCVDDDGDNGTGGSTSGLGSCTYNECRDGGTDFCIAKGATGCRQIAGAPCIECTDSTTSENNNRPLNGACTNTECRDGGDFYCAQNGAEGCAQIPGAPCIQCGNDTDDDGTLDEFLTPEDPSEVAQTQCRNDFDCPAGLCMNGWCSLECSNDSECATGLCTGGRCEVCEADEQCSTNRCVSGRCSACTSDDQCSFGVCSQGICAECATDAHCTNGERCVGNRCLQAVLVAALPSYCGNGRTDPGESCDDGSGNSDLPGGLCRTDCRSGRCGDNIPDMPLESCDDGNMLNGDGCSSICQMERSAPQTLPATVVELPFVPEMSGGGVGGTIGGMVNANGSTVAANVGTIGQGGVQHPPATADTGPAAIAVMAAGAAAGYAYVRRKKA